MPWASASLPGTQGTLRRAKLTCLDAPMAQHARLAALLFGLAAAAATAANAADADVDAASAAPKQQQPHIIYILSDNLGWVSMDPAVSVALTLLPWGLAWEAPPHTENTRCSFLPKTMPLVHCATAKAAWRCICHASAVP